MSEQTKDTGPAEGPVVAERKVKAKRPPMYRVVLLNDDYTPMEFVVYVLQVVFHKGQEESTRLMLDVHTTGKGVCGVFTYDVARTKAYQVEKLAQKHEHPLQCQLEIVESE
jgi:ATP-dependent Clp protease adaptor protein ClpS